MFDFTLEEMEKYIKDTIKRIDSNSKDSYLTFDYIKTTITEVDDYVVSLEIKKKEEDDE